MNLLPSATDDVNYGEHNDPDRIHEMPIQRKDVRPLAVLWFHFAQESENHANDENDQTRGDVKRVQADKRVIRRAKKIRAYGQVLFENQVLPLTARFDQENDAQCNGHEPPQSKHADLRDSQSFHSEVKRQTARK